MEEPVIASLITVPLEMSEEIVLDNRDIDPPQETELPLEPESQDSPTNDSPEPLIGAKEEEDKPTTGEPGDANTAVVVVNLSSDLEGQEQVVGEVKESPKSFVNPNGVPASEKDEVVGKRYTPPSLPPTV